MDKYSRLMNMKNQCEVASSSQYDLQIYCNLNQNPSKLFGEYQQNDLKFIQGQNTHNSQHNIEGERQWKAETICHHGIL